MKIRSVILVIIYLLVNSLSSAQWRQSGLSAGFVHAFLASDTNLYLGTNVGAFRSADSGIHWTSINEGLSDKKFRSLASVGNILFATTYYDGLLRSSDNGNTWKHINANLTSKADNVTTIGHYLFVSTQFGVFRSIDSGTSWVEMNIGLLDYRKISKFAVRDTELLVGTSGTVSVYRSTDLGVSWIPAKLKNTTVTSIVGTDSTLLIGTNDDGVLLSTDGGETWSNAGPQQADIYSLTNIDGSVLMTSDSGVFLTHDNGKNWTPLTVGEKKILYSEGGYMGRYMYLGSFGYVYRSSDNGNTWTTNIGIGGKDVSSFCAFDSVVLAGTGGDGIFRTTNDGYTWSAATNGLTEYDVNALISVNTNVFAGTSAGVFRSTKNNISWSKSTTGLPNGVIIMCLTTNGVDIFAGSTSGSVYRSSNNGDSWSSIKISSTSNYIASMAVLGNSLFAGTNGSGVYRSYDKGATWSAVNSGLTEKNINRLLVCGSDLISCTTNGMFRSTNNGATWTSINSGSPNEPISAFTVSGKTLFARSPQVKCYYSNNSGSSWVMLEGGLISGIVSGIVTRNQYLLVGLHLDGVWGRSLAGMLSVKDDSKEEKFSDIVLEQNYPNPVTSKTTIIYTLLHSNDVSMSICNTLGQEITAIFDKKVEAGKHEILFDASFLPSGTYFYRLQAGKSIETRMFIVAH